MRRKLYPVWNSALGQGSWLIYDHYPRVREWSPNFYPEVASIDCVDVWVSFSSLPIEYYDPSFLHFARNRTGRSIKDDKTTISHDRGKYTRLCVEVDLTNPLLAVFEVKDRQYKIEYEGLHLLCLKCGRFRHYKEGCSYTVVEPRSHQGDTSNDVDLSKGDTMWTIVQKIRGNKRKNQASERGEGGQDEKQRNGSRFTVFSEKETLKLTTISLLNL